MKKMIGLSVGILMLLMCGCGSDYYGRQESEEIAYQKGYESGYSDGRDDGYDNGYDKGYDDCLEDNSYQNDSDETKMRIYGEIVELMYNQEYETIEVLLSFLCEDVENALEEEFGTRNYLDVKAYLEEMHETTIGTCEICGEVVYWGDSAILPDGIECAHQYCIGEDNDYPRIEKDR